MIKKKKPMMGMSVIEIDLGKPKRNKMKKRYEDEEELEDEIDWGDFESESDEDMDDMDEELVLEDDENLDMEEADEESEIAMNVMDAVKAKDLDGFKVSMREYVQFLIDDIG